MNNLMEFKPFVPYITYEPEDLNKICKTLKDYDKNIDIEHFYKIMRSGLLNYRVLPFVVYNEEREMIACVVLEITSSSFDRQSVLYIQWVWIDPHYPDYWKEGMKFLEDLARQLNIKKIVGNTKRLPQAFEKKFGFKQTDSIIEKEVI